MNPTSRKLFLFAALLVAGSALGFVAFGNIGENLVYYWNPSQVREAGDSAYGATIRLGGVVKSMDWNDDKSELWFEVSDPGKDATLNTEDDVTLRVHSQDGPPQMFRVGIGVVVEGTMVKGGHFESDRLMVKHSNEYKAPEDGVEDKELYQTVEDM